MVAVASCFAQILALIDRAEFARAVRQHAAERVAEGFTPLLCANFVLKIV